MKKQDSDNSRQAKIWERSENSLIEIFRTINDESVEELIDRLRISWRKEVLRIHHKNAKKLEEKMAEGEEALGLLHRAFRMLQVTDVESSSQNLMEEARESFEKKDYQQAFKLFQIAIANQTPHVDDLCLAGTAALHIGKKDYAEEYAEQALLRNCFEYRAIVLKGMIRFSEGDFKEAADHFEKANRLEPNRDTVIKYLKLTKEKLTLESQVHAPNSTSALKSKQASNVLQPNEAAKRRWFRKPTQLPITVSDFESMAAMMYRLKSLSAGGALVLGEGLPDEFHFSINLGSFDRIEGHAKKIYNVNNQEFGVIFVDLDPAQQDQITRHLKS